MKNESGKLQIINSKKSCTVTIDLNIKFVTHKAPRLKSRGVFFLAQDGTE